MSGQDQSSWADSCPGSSADSPVLEINPLLPLRKKKKRQPAGWKRMPTLEKRAQELRDWGKQEAEETTETVATENNDDSVKVEAQAQAQVEPEVVPVPVEEEEEEVKVVVEDVVEDVVITPVVVETPNTQESNNNNNDDEEVSAATDAAAAAAAEPAPSKPVDVVTHEEDALWAAYKAQCMARTSVATPEAKTESADAVAVAVKAPAAAESDERSPSPSSVSSEYASSRPSRSDADEADDEVAAMATLTNSGKSGSSPDDALSVPKTPKSAGGPAVASPVSPAGKRSGVAPASTTARAPAPVRAVPSYASAASKAAAANTQPPAQAPVRKSGAGSAQPAPRRSEVRKVIDTTAKTVVIREQPASRRGGAQQSQAQAQAQQSQQQQQRRREPTGANTARHAWVVSNATEEASYSSEEETATTAGGRRGVASGRRAGADMSWSAHPRDEASWSTELGAAADRDESSWSSTALHLQDEESSWSVVPPASSSVGGSKRGLGLGKAQQLAQGLAHSGTGGAATATAGGEDDGGDDATSANANAGSRKEGHHTKLSQGEQLARRRLRRKQHAAKKLAAMAAEGVSGSTSSSSRAAAASSSSASASASASSGVSSSTLRTAIIVALTALVTVGVLYARGALSGTGGRAENSIMDGLSGGAGRNNVYVVPSTSIGQDGQRKSCIKLPDGSQKVAGHMLDLSYDEIVVFYDTDGDGNLSIQEVAAAVFPEQTEPTAEVVNAATELLLYINRRMRMGPGAVGEDVLPPCAPTNEMRRLSDDEATALLGLDELGSVVPRDAREEATWEESLKAGDSKLWDTMRSSFSFYDQNADQRVSQEELIAVFSLLDPSMAEAEMRKSFAEADRNGNGIVEFSEFVRMVNKDLTAAH